MRQKKRTQEKTKKTKQRIQRKIKGGFHTIESDVEEVDMHVDIPQYFQRIADDMISLPFMQKRTILNVNQQFISLRSRYIEEHPNEMVDELHELFRHETTDILLYKLSLNINNTLLFIYIMIQDNNINTAIIIHDFIMSQIKPLILICIENRDHAENAWIDFTIAMNDQSIYQRQLIITFTEFTKFSTMIFNKKY